MQCSSPYRIYSGRERTVGGCGCAAVQLLLSGIMSPWSLRFKGSSNRQVSGPRKLVYARVTYNKQRLVYKDRGFVPPSFRSQLKFPNKIHYCKFALHTNIHESQPRVQHASYQDSR